MRRRIAPLLAAVIGVVLYMVTPDFWAFLVFGMAGLILLTVRL